MQKGITLEELKQCYKEAKLVGKKTVLTPQDLEDEVNESLFGDKKTKDGYFLPFVDPEKNIVFRPRTLTVWTGTNGHGKSQYLGFVLAHQIQQGAKVFIASFELPPFMLIQNIMFQVLGGIPKSKDEVKLAREFLSDGLWIYNHSGSSKIDVLLSLFRYVIQKHGVNVIMIDNLMRCGIREDNYADQAEFVEKLCHFKDETGCQIHLVVHLRKKGSESDDTDKMDIKGSGAITDQADYVFCVLRNKPKEKVLRGEKIVPPDQYDKMIVASDMMLICHKNRYTGHEQNYHYWFDQKTLCYYPDGFKKPDALVDVSLAGIG